ncbi:MAG: ATP-dependent helicase, partial [Nanoarchaeota archaeon]|nr:ATP-dependent helicase [Nanoarchaeota archaeon]
CALPIFSLLVHLLQKEKSALVMVFCNTRRTTEFVEKALRNNRVNAMAIHGGLSQNKRNKVIQMFNQKKISILICTDVAARGLHIDNVSHVYNYDIPKDAKDYVHRIGRTARAGEEGKVINLLAQNDYDNFSRVMREYPSFKIVSIQKPFLEHTIQMDSRPQRGNSRRAPQRGHSRGGPQRHQRHDRSERNDRSDRHSRNEPRRERNHEGPEKYNWGMAS